MPLESNYWNERYQQENTPWNLGQVSPPLKAFIDTLSDLNLRILIPGAGRAYEAIYLHDRGFRNVHICDWAEDSFRKLKEMAPHFPKENMLVADFFSLKGSYDLMLEQTFFCAIDPSYRQDYAKHAARLLVPGGVLAGVLFASNFSKPGPPFGGTSAEYRRYFEADFHIDTLEPCRNSILPRAGNELFLKFIRR